MSVNDAPVRNAIRDDQPGLFGQVWQKWFSRKVTPALDQTEGSARLASFPALIPPRFSLNGTEYYAVAVGTNGTTPVNVFGAGGAPIALTVTAVFVIAQDTTAGNITLKQAANTVVTIAKGTVSGGMVGGVGLANTAYAVNDGCTVVSSSAGNATVVILFQVKW